MYMNDPSLYAVCSLYPFLWKSRCGSPMTTAILVSQPVSTNVVELVLTPSTRTPSTVMSQKPHIPFDTRLPAPLIMSFMSYLAKNATNSMWARQSKHSETDSETINHLSETTLTPPLPDTSTHQTTLLTTYSLQPSITYHTQKHTQFATKKLSGLKHSKLHNH